MVFVRGLLILFIIYNNMFVIWVEPSMFTVCWWARPRLRHSLYMGWHYFDCLIFNAVLYVLNTIRFLNYLLLNTYLYYLPNCETYIWENLCYSNPIIYQIPLIIYASIQCSLFKIIYVSVCYLAVWNTDPLSFPHYINYIFCVHISKLSSLLSLVNH